MDWQPIETAPKDRPVLTYGPLGVRILEWVEEEYTPDPEDGRDGFPAYEPYTGWSDDSTDTDYTGSWAPTHWMPLPEPPDNEKEPTELERC